MGKKKIPENIYEILINKQFEMNGYPQDCEEVKKTNFFEYRVTTPALEKEYIKWLEEYLLQYMNKQRVKKAVSWYILWYWLRTSLDELPPILK